MEKRPSNPWWSMGLTRRDAVPEADYADMGTAFGLDASMAPPDWAEPDAADDTLLRKHDRLNGRSVL